MSQRLVRSMYYCSLKGVVEVLQTVTFLKIQVDCLLPTGHSLSEALILASINPKYDDRLLSSVQEKYKFSTCCIHQIVCFDIKDNLMYTTCSFLESNL